MSAQPPALEAIVANVLEEIDVVFSSAERMATAVGEAFESHPGGVGRRDLEVLRPLISSELAAHPHFVGCGFVAGIDVLRDAHRYWEWLAPDGESGGPPRPLRLQTGHQGGETYAYEQMEWFSTARDGSRTVVGPYMDFAGADRLVLTFAHPVMHHDRFIGVTGADVPVGAFEALLNRTIMSTPEPVAVVNREGRVIVSNSADAFPAERLRGDQESSIAISSLGVSWALCRLGPTTTLSAG